MRHGRRVVLLLALFANAAGGATVPTGDVDGALRQLIQQRGLRGDPTIGRAIPRIEEPLAQLGMKLFFSKGLSGDMDTACASCHHPLLGGGDGVALSTGVSTLDPDVLGQPRRHTTNRFFFSDGPTVGRNAPTTFNIALWDSVLFHDGRVESLGKTPGKSGDDGKGIRTPDSNYGVADHRAVGDLVAVQARFPVVAVAEMLGKYGAEDVYEQERIRQRLAARLSDSGKSRGEIGRSTWVAEFRKLFATSEPGGSPISYDRIAQALAAYQRSQVFVRSPWAAYVQGDEAAIDAAAKRGALLFYRTRDAGGVDCASCHHGDFFTDEDFHVIAVPQVGRGKGNGPNGCDDFGRYRTTTEQSDKYKFRTPSLLNVEVTGPYGHSGAYATLDGIVRHHLDPEAAAAGYDDTQLAPDIKRDFMHENTENALRKLSADRAARASKLQNASLSDVQVGDLVSFLRSLTDPCVKSPACLAPWIPSGPGPDGLTLQAKLPGTSAAARAD